jgi:hypothetical protein
VDGIRRHAGLLPCHCRMLACRAGPIIPQQQTSDEYINMSEKCQEETHAVQQIAFYSITSPLVSFLRGYIETGESRSALPTAAPCEKLRRLRPIRFGKATVGYVIHRISRVNCSNVHTSLRYSRLGLGSSMTAFAQDMTEWPA